MQYMMLLTAQNSQGTAGDQSCGGKVGEEVKDPYFMNIFIIITRPRKPWKPTKKHEKP